MNDLDHRPYLADTDLRTAEDVGRTLERLSGPHALVEVARLAGVN